MVLLNNRKKVYLVYSICFLKAHVYFISFQFELTNI